VEAIKQNTQVHSGEPTMKESSGERASSPNQLIELAVSSNRQILGHTEGPGLVFSNTRLPVKLTFTNKEFNGIDFNEVDFGSAIFVRCIFSGCTFSRSDLSNCRFFEHCGFTDCRFVHCDMSSIGMRLCTFVACNFENVDLRGASLNEAGFARCRLRKCKVRDTCFNVQKIDDLGIEGTLVEVIFEGQSFADKPRIDLSLAKFNGVSFVNCDTSQIRIPIGSDVVYLDNLSARVANALKAVVTVKETETQKILARRLRQYAGRPNAIFDRKYLEKYDQGPTFWAHFFSLLDAP
jgi:fluoroquinolone resistance protein